MLRLEAKMKTERPSTESAGRVLASLHKALEPHLVPSPIAEAAAIAAFATAATTLEQQLEAIAAEATAAFKARVRVQAIQPSPRNRARPWRCGLCKGEWWSRNDERHIATPDGQPCAAEVEP